MFLFCRLVLNAYARMVRIFEYIREFSKKVAIRKILKSGHQMYLLEEEKDFKKISGYCTFHIDCADRYLAFPCQAAVCTAHSCSWVCPGQAAAVCAAHSSSSVCPGQAAAVCTAHSCSWVWPAWTAICTSANSTWVYPGISASGSWVWSVACTSSNSSWVIHASEVVCPSRIAPASGACVN